MPVRLTSILAFILIAHSNVNNPDALLYHLPFSKILNDYKILIGSSIPGKSVPTVFDLKWDKLVHLIEYFFLGILGYRAYANSYKNITFIISMFGIVFGCIDESI